LIHCNHCSEIDENAQKQIKDWHDRIEKATMNVSTHLFKEVLDVVKEMGKELETTDY